MRRDPVLTERLHADSLQCGARKILTLGLQYRGYVVGDLKRDSHPDLPHPLLQMRERTENGPGANRSSTAGRRNIALRLQHVQGLGQGDRIMTCESCQRILYYNPPVRVEDLTGEPAEAAK
jgi:hypothetical protein